MKRKKLKKWEDVRQPQAGSRKEVQENRTRIAMRAQEDLGSFAEFEFEKIMKRTYASTRLRLYPHPDVQSRLLRPSIMHNADGASVRNTDDALEKAAVRIVMLEATCVRILALAPIRKSIRGNTPRQ